jgi:hypothetical protein
MVERSGASFPYQVKCAHSKRAKGPYATELEVEECPLPSLRSGLSRRSVEISLFTQVLEIHVFTSCKRVSLLG